MFPSAPYDLKRTSRNAIYGLLILGPSQHLWFNFLSKILPKRRMPAILMKTFMSYLFFSYSGALKGIILLFFSLSLYDSSLTQFLVDLDCFVLPYKNLFEVEFSKVGKISLRLNVARKTVHWKICSCRLCGLVEYFPTCITSHGLVKISTIDFFYLFIMIILHLVI